MKKQLLFTTLVLTTMISFAQTQKGNFMIGGDFSFSSDGGGSITTTNSSKTQTVDQKARINWNFSPTVAMFMKDNVALGGQLLIGSTNQDQAKSTDGKTIENVASLDFGLSAFYRKYKPVSDRFFIYWQGGLGIASSSWVKRVPDATSQSALIDGNKVSSFGYGINLTPGFTYFVSPKWGIDFQLKNMISYMSKTTTDASNDTSKDPTVETKSSTINLSAGLTPSLGLYYYFSYPIKK